MSSQPSGKSNPSVLPSKPTGKLLPISKDSVNKRTKCSPKICPDACDAGTGTLSLEKAHPRDLLKRFLDIPEVNPGSFVIQLLIKSYCKNLSPSPTRYFWETFSDTRKYASAVRGLYGCVGIFAALEKGAFSAHIWEVDENTKVDLHPGNYKEAMKAQSSNRSPHKADLTGGELF